MQAIPEQIDTASLLAIAELFESLSDVLFWVKDRELRVVMLNQAFADRVNLPKAEILGKTDADLYFPELARAFMIDDREVMQSGQSIIRKMELLTNRFGGVEWRSTTKLPMRDASGQIVGATGISRPISGSSEQLPPPYRAFGELIEYCRGQLAGGIDVDAMAKHAGMSTATLSRRFRQYLNLSPGEFLAQLRLSRACKLLTDSPYNITEIALECGYESPAAFSRAFSKQMQQSPSQYREALKT